MNNQITLENVKSYATEANLLVGLKRLNLLEFAQQEGQSPCRFIVSKTPAGRWTAIFLVSEFLNMNKTGGYVCFASQYGFMSI